MLNGLLKKKKEVTEVANRDSIYRSHENTKPKAKGF